MRLFTAVLPSGDAREHLRAALAPVPREPARLRWADPDWWHLTVAYFGEVADEQVPELAARIAGAVSRHPPFTAAIEGAGHFGGRVLWAGLAGEVPAAHALAGAVREAAIPADARRDLRPYRPHITLARTTDRDPAPLDRQLAALSGYRGPEWRATEVLLVRTNPQPSPQGLPRYQALERLPLATAG
ncbi:RNA 2',3'-cyclic phosphodiesterase [Allonocardiopsis opalescens]|uniref:RNA 2',3'-cyclic phosphodiesterase n=1 Tax=Allonocardiopsis opalescens TaxID=1144618 RepID=A0A2T0Q4F0_9ACTN|nr:RNA 2',3'-cyclic phosphodiesterase [Allonocardiopsis opalescens]PRX98672.1 2'-5' RNA ligase [Allonocardiopsis opalescens]